MLVDKVCKAVFAAVAIAIPSEIRAAPASANCFKEMCSTELTPTFTGIATLLQTFLTFSMLFR